MNHKDSTGNYIQYLGMINSGKESERENTPVTESHVCIPDTQ